jgi:ribosome biogenesis GTPase
MPFTLDPQGSPASRDLSDLGFDDRWAALLADAADTAHYPDPAGTVEPARVIRDDRGSVFAAGATWERRLDLPHDLAPVAGDWIGVRDGTVVAVLPRATALARPRPDGAPQVLAANVDFVGVVHGLDVPLNRRRLERGLVLAWDSGAIPAVLLTKADLSEDIDAVVAEAEASAPGTEVLTLSTVDGRGLDALAALLRPARTLALLGASGAGKSSLVNALLGNELLATQGVRRGDHKGRHTTTHRELITLPGGGVLLDTPGLRALSMAAADEGVGLAFPEIEELAAACRFADCTHQHEPDCAVLAAVADHSVSADRYEGWRRIRREADSAALRADPAAFRKRAREWGRASREAIRVKQGGDRRGRE